MQHPMVGVLSGGALVDFDAQERRAWARMADAAAEALTLMDPHHPERSQFVEMWTECRRAAGRPLSPAVRLTA